MSSLFDLLLPPWNLVLSAVAIIVAGGLILDADWMRALVRDGLRSAPPPLFRAPIRIEGRRRQAGYLALAIFGIAPLIMQPVMGVLRLLVWPLNVGILFGLVISVILTLVAEARGWALVGTLGAITTTALMGAPYALAGPVGWTRYAVVASMMAAIVLLLFLAAQLRSSALAYRPRSRAGAWTRLFLDGTLALGVMAVTFWPWIDVTSR
jgi:hypothetical protein